MSANGLAAEAVTELRIARNEESRGPEENNAAALDNALTALAVYIPSEAMALYLAVSSSLDAIEPTFKWMNPPWVYWAFVFGFSPGLFLLAYFAKLAKTNSQFPTSRQFPWFRLGSSIIAFAAWGLCVPGNNVVGATAGAGVLCGIGATLVSIVLPSAEAIYNWLTNLPPKV